MVMAVGLAVSTQAIAPSGGAGAASSSGGMLTQGYPFSDGINPIEFDPVQFTGPAGFFSYNWPVYSGFLRLTTSGALVPDLASSVTIPDPSTINIQVRPGLVYSNGTPLDANAAKAGFMRNLSNPHPGAWDAPMNTLSSIDVTGPTSLVLHFSSPDAATFYPLLSDQEGFMALPTGPSNGPPNTNVVGAGPFMVQSYAPDSKLVLVKNPKYWNAKSIKLSGITEINVPSGPQQLNSLRSGLVDVEGIPAADFGEIKSLTGSLQTSSVIPDANYFDVPVCKASGPLANTKVRQAMSYAVNRVAINNALLHGLGEPAWSIFPSTSQYYDKSLTNIYAYNVKKAKQLMAQAGYPNGFSTSLMALPEADTAQIATVLQSEWAQIGIKMTIIPTTNYVSDLYQDNKAQMGLNPSGLPGISKLTTQFIPGGSVGDICNYSNPTLNALTQQIESLPPTSPKLRAAWVQAQDIIIRNALDIYIDFVPLVTGAAKSVTNLQDVPYVGGVLNYWVVGLK